jgi:tetratricopeptide (TPR) repeat protein
MERMQPSKKLAGFVLWPICIVLISGCFSKTATPVAKPQTSAKELFEHTAKNFQIPSAEAKDSEKTTLQDKAAAGYEQLLKSFPDDPLYAPQAERNLGNIRAAQGRIDEAVKHFDAVGKKYPSQDWEVLMAWKSAGDLLWESGRKDEAKKFYQSIISRYDGTNAPAITRTVVKGSKLRLSGGDLPAER